MSRRTETAPALRHGGPARGVATALLAIALAGCGALGRMAPVSPSAYAALDCNGLNQEVAGVSKRLSRAAIDRGRVERIEPPKWAPAGETLKTAVVERMSAKVDRLREEERAVAAARNRGCTGLAAPG